MSLPKFLEDLNPEIYLSDNYVVVDFEVDTSHGDYGHPVFQDNQLLLSCWKLAGTPVYSCWDNELGHHELLHAISSVDFVVAHNAKYELGWLKRMGVDLHDVLVYDTKLGEYVLLGNLAAGSKK